MYSKKLQKILENEQYYAHLDSSGLKKEPLLSHLEVTLKYYNKLNKYKNLETIIRNIIKNITNNISTECENKIYEMFLNAIYYHDIGKINPNFQIEKMKNKKEKEGNIIGSNHSLLSAKIYINEFEGEIIRSNNKDFIIVILFIYYFGFVISKHHSKIDGIKDFLDNIQNIDLPKICAGITSSIKDKNNILSKIKQSQKIDEISIYILVKLLYSILISCDYYATYEFMSGKEINFKNKESNLFEQYEKSEVFKIINSYKNKNLELNRINKLRSDIFLETEENLLNNLKNSNIFYLEAPTGSGKTNTSINLARQIYKTLPGISSINYIFPFNTLIEQTQNVFEKYFKINKDFVVINNITPIIECDNENADYEKIYIDNLFRNYPITITSHVNLFNSLFGIGKEANFSLVDFCNSVIILDEIQVYKNKIWREILLMLEKFAELLNIKIIIMSATLPKLDLLSLDKKINSCNLISDINKYYKNDIFKNRVEINYELLEREITLESLKEEVLKQKDRKVLIEFIKKQDARDFYNLLRDENINLFEITGDDNNYERKKTLENISKLDNVIVVCTQTIEAGVDIDMDIGFKDISFIDSEEQFLGRINRSNSKKNCKAYFFNYTDAKNIYRSDRRIGYDLFDVELQTVLIQKNFNKYFNALLEKIKIISEKNDKDNIDGFLDNCLNLKFREISDKLKLIDNNQQQIFLNFTYVVEDKEIVGKDVWRKYCELYKDKELGYAEKQIKISQLRDYMNIFMYNVNLYEKSIFYTDELTGILYIENGEEFIENGKFNRQKFLKFTGGNFL